MPDSDINIVIARLGSIHEDVGELKTTVRDLAQAVSRLALIEERQSAANQAVGRAFNEIREVKVRVDALEKSQPIHELTSSWVRAAVWGIASMGAYVVAKTSGLL